MYGIQRPPVEKCGIILINSRSAGAVHVIGVTMRALYTLGTLGTSTSLVYLNICIFDSDRKQINLNSKQIMEWNMELKNLFTIRVEYCNSLIEYGRQATFFSGIIQLGLVKVEVACSLESFLGIIPYVKTGFVWCILYTLRILIAA